MNIKLQQLIKRICSRAYLDSEEEIGKWIDNYIQSEVKSYETNRLIGELLAVMYGDGGHHQEKVGTDQAIKDAMALLHTKWVLNGWNIVKSDAPSASSVDKSGDKPIKDENQLNAIKDDKPTAYFDGTK